LNIWVFLQFKDLNIVFCERSKCQPRRNRILWNSTFKLYFISWVYFVKYSVKKIRHWRVDRLLIQLLLLNYELNMNRLLLFLTDLNFWTYQINYQIPRVFWATEQLLTAAHRLFDLKCDFLWSFPTISRYTSHWKACLSVV